MTIEKHAAALVVLACIVTSASTAEDRWHRSSWTMVEGGVVRGDSDRREIALVFTADQFGEGAPQILDTLHHRHVKASFFLTGTYLDDPKNEACLRRMVADGHYVGPHSHKHLLLCSWDDRSQSLVSEKEFKDDLARNLTSLRQKGIPLREPIYFIPPFEWYNSLHVRWASERGNLLFTFTPGSGSHRDWIPESHPQFQPSAKLLEGILSYEREQADGLNGHLLLLHLGSERKDKMASQLDRLVQELQQRGYAFLKVDQLLRVKEGTPSR